MGRLIKWFNIIIKKQKGAKRWQKVVTVMAAMITFATTYALILPAITVEKNSTEEVGGMYLEQTAEQDELLEENALEPNGVSIAADMDNAVTFAYSDDDMSATAVFSTDEIIPEGTELVVSIVDPASEEYAALRGRSEGLLDKEFIYDVTTCAFYDYALVCDNIDVTPKTGLVDIQIIFRNNTVQHIDDVVYAGRFVRPAEEADGLAALSAGEEDLSDDTITAGIADAADELVAVNVDESSVIEFNDGIITSLSLKGSDLSRSDSIVGILAGNVDEEIKAAAAETDAEIPDYDEPQGEEDSSDAEADEPNSAEEADPDSSAEDTQGAPREGDGTGTDAAPQVKTLKASGSDYSVILTYDETSGIPAGAALTVSEIAQESEEYQTYLKETKKAMGLAEEETLPRFAARFFDIKIMVDGKEFTPESGVSVEITYAEPLAEHSNTEVSAVHFEDEKAEAEVIEANTAKVQDDGKATVEFTAESFSVYGVIYTVDFHWEVDGKTYDYSIPGGGYVTLRQLVEVLGIGNSGTNEEAITLNNVASSEKTREFVADVASVEFSSPELVWVGKTENSATVGQLKEANGLEVQYSAELSEEQIEEINNSTVEACDWALIGMQPFESEETLTVTMKNGDQFAVKVTDANVPASKLSTDKHYILYGIYEGQYYALKGDGSCYRVPNNNLDALYDDENFHWYYHIENGEHKWRSPVGYNYNYINLYYERDTSAIWRDWGSDIYLESDSSGGYYFRTDSWDGNTYTLWLYYDYDSSQWRFVSGSGEGNGSVTYIYEKGQAHKLTVNVDDESSGAGWVYLNGWTHEGQTDINNDGTNANVIVAGPSSGSGYWFDHWELDEQPVSWSDAVTTYLQDGEIYGRIDRGGLNIGNEDGHVLTAVFVPETSFNIVADPLGGGTVNKSTSPRTKDGFNKEEIVATAASGYWFGHWEIDGVEVPADSYTIAADGKSSRLPERSLQIGDGNTLTAVFIPQIQYNVVVYPETEGLDLTGCTVQVGEGSAAVSVSDNAMTRWGYNVDAITATAGPAVIFKGWYRDNGEQILGGADIVNTPDGLSSTIQGGTLCVSPDGQQHTIRAVFGLENKFTVAASPSNGGTVQDGDKVEEAGVTTQASITSDGHNRYQITATPNTDANFMFSHWMLNGKELMEGGSYLYTNGIIPAGVLDVVSSDNLVAVFIDSYYTISASAARANNTNVGRVSNGTTHATGNGSQKQAETDITASVNSNYQNNYKFAYWEVSPNGAVVDWGNGHSQTSSTIRPTVTGDTTLTAYFVEKNARTYIVKTEDPQKGMIWGQDVRGSAVNVNGVDFFVGRTNGSNNNSGSIEARFAINNYKFDYWELQHSDGSFYQRIDNFSIANNSLNFPEDNMILVAHFAEKYPGNTPPPFEDEQMEILSNWADGIAETDFETEKTAEVFDYDNRIYKIGMSASSNKQAIDTSVVINFVVDTSRSMYFPATLLEGDDGNGGLYGGYYGNYDGWFQGNNGWQQTDGHRMEQWLNDHGHTNWTYYFIGKQQTTATVYAVYYQNGNWYYVDASYYPQNADDGMTKTGSRLNGYNRTTNSNPPDDQMIYSTYAKTGNAPYSRLDYLCMSVEAAAEAIYEICPNAQIDLTTFNRSASYKGTLPKDAEGIRRMVRGVDVAGGTRQDLGIAAASGTFIPNSSKRQVVVLVTDGAPNATNTNTTEAKIWRDAQATATELKNLVDAYGNKLEVYTMGLSIENVGNNQSKLFDCATDEDHQFSVNTGEETREAVQQMVENMLTNVSLFGSVTDMVDPAFYPVDKDGSPISAGLYAMDGSSLNERPEDTTPYYEWTEDNGTWKIVWYNQTMPWKADGIHGWHREFFIKAKEDFLGGNRIETNKGETNGITATGYVKADKTIAPLKDNQPVSKLFDYTPYVNVDELHMDKNDTEWTVYLGTQVNPAKQIVNLLNEIPVKQVVNPGGTNNDGIYITGSGQMYYPHSSDAVDNADDSAPSKGASQILPLSHYVDFTSDSIRTKVQAALNTLAEGSEDSVMVDNIVYDEYGHAAGTFKVIIMRNLVDSQARTDGAPNLHETKLHGNAVETYTLTVQYTPYTDADHLGGTAAANSYEHTTVGGAAGQITNGTGANEVKSVNTHVINVIKRELEVIKTDTDDQEITKRQATFKLYRALKSGETADTSITVDGQTVDVKQVGGILTTGGAEGANKVNSLPWYTSSDGEHDGLYYLKEETQPAGYLKLTEPVVITLARANAYTDLNKAAIEEPVEGEPYNNTQSASVSYETSSGSTDAEETSGVFEVRVPNPPSGSLAVRKQVQTVGGADLSVMNGQYYFSVSGPVGSNNPVTYYVYFDVVDGEMTHYRLDKYLGNNAEPVVANRISSETGTVSDQDVGCLISNIETGIYAMKEYDWTLTTPGIDSDDIYLKDIILVPASGGNTNNMLARTTSVYVMPDNPDEPQVLTVTFLNEYRPDIYKMYVKKIWQAEDGTTLTDPWDGMISAIEFSVTQIKTPASGEPETRQLTFGGSSRLTIQRRGMCAVVTASEPGSTAYDVQMANGGDQWQIFISGLEETAPDGSPYTYKIEELSVKDVFGEVVTGYETTYDLSEDGGALIQESGTKIGIEYINDDATAFINNKKIEEAELNLKKVVETSNDNPLNGDLTLTDGSYEFTVTGPEGSETPVAKYVKIYAQSTDNGEYADPRYTTAYTYQIGDTVAERDAMAAAAVVDGGVPIQGLTPGKYTITETGWDLTTSSNGGLMYLKDIDVSSGSNNETDLSEKAAEVYVGEGEVGSLEVAFTNALKPYPGIQIEKIDETTRPVDKTTKYLAGAEFQILKWNGTNYAVYPNEDASKAVTGTDGIVTFGGVEPGEYKIVETVSPAGYVKLMKNDIFINVAYNESTGLHTITRYKEAYTGDDNAVRTQVAESENLMGVTFDQATDDESPAAFVVGNEPGAALPNTGGPGTSMYYFLGIILAGIAGAALIIKRRMKVA